MTFLMLLRPTSTTSRTSRFLGSLRRSNVITRHGKNWLVVMTRRQEVGWTQWPASAANTPC